MSESTQQLQTNVKILWYVRAENSCDAHIVSYMELRDSPNPFPI